MSGGDGGLRNFGNRLIILILIDIYPGMEQLVMWMADVRSQCLGAGEAPTGKQS